MLEIAVTVDDDGVGGSGVYNDGGDDSEAQDNCSEARELFRSLGVGSGIGHFLREAPL